MTAKAINTLKTPHSSELSHNDRLGLQATANRWITQNALAFDTETTGLGEKDQIIEMALVDRLGNTLINCQFKPSVPIHPKAQEVHGISAESLNTAPKFSALADKILQLLTTRPLIIFNVEYDLRLLKQTCDAFDIPIDLEKIKAHCAMEMAAGFYGATNRHGTISLANAMDRANVEWEGDAHTAKADALATMNLVKAIAFDPVAPFADESKVIPNLQYQIDSNLNTITCLQLKLDHYKMRGYNGKG